MIHHGCAELDGGRCLFTTCSTLGCFIARSLATMRASRAEQHARRRTHHDARRTFHDASPSKAERPRCGAKTRSGTICRALAVWDKAAAAPRNGRCRLHGGLSTGPRTQEGRQRIAAAQHKRWKDQRNFGIGRGADRAADTHGEEADLAQRQSKLSKRFRKYGGG